MKKSIIAAGAASVALAAMPIMGVFAADFTDTINTNIGESCTFSRNATTPHGNTGTWSTPSGASDTLTATTITPGVESTLGSSKFTIVCNDDDGYEVTYTAEDLSITNGHGSMTFDASATAGGSNAGKWYLSSSQTGLVAGHNVASGSVAYSTATTTADNFEVTYYAYPAAAQAGGDYTGDVVYTFAQLGD